MSKKDKDKQSRLRQAQYEKEADTIREFRQKAVQLKPLLREVGCDLPFYDFLDSYEHEYGNIIRTATKELTTLLGVHEVDKKEFQDTAWAQYSVDPNRQIFFNLDERFSQYSSGDKRKANLRGFASFFFDDHTESSFKSVVILERNPECRYLHKDLKYMFKVGSLLHELGHVHDAENRIGIDPIVRRFDVIEAEAYANCYALERLADRCLLYTYNMLYDALAVSADSSGYEAEVGKLVMERHQRRQIPNWNDFMDAATKRAASRR